MKAQYDAKRIAESAVGREIVWIDEVTGYLECPGISFHTNANSKRDCRIKLDGAPTISCFHQSCSCVIDEMNRKLRSGLAKAVRGGAIEKYHPTAADPERKCLQMQEKALEERAAAALPGILKAFAIEEAEFRASSPVPLPPDPRNDWRLLLSLFHPDDLVWIGDTRDSANETATLWKRRKAALHFRTCADWLKEPTAPGNFTCPSTFKLNSVSRSNENILIQLFLVVESDPKPDGSWGLGRPQMLALIQWLRRSLRLRAVVCTGGKSLHGWFDYPEPRFLDELRTILPALQCDEALFKASQPVRLPGAFRQEKGKLQSLIWFGGSR